MSGRIRSIKPEILEDEKVAQLSHLEFRLFVGSWLLADDYGNLRGDPDYVRGRIVWSSRESRETVAKALDTLARLSLLCPYRVREQSYLHIAGWSKHQRVDKPGKPQMPGPDDVGSTRIQVVASDSRESREDPANVRESLAPDLRPTTRTNDQEEDQEGSGEEPQMPTPHGVSSPVGDFLSFADKVDEVTGDIGAARARPVREKRAALRSAKRKPSDPTPAEVDSVRVVLGKLSAASGVQYRGSEEHTRLIVGRLRDGMTEMDLRAVVAYCAYGINGKGWAEDPKMATYLRPSTLFGPEKIHDYLDPARTWAAKAQAEEQAQKARPVVVVDDVDTRNVWDRLEGAADDEPEWMNGGVQ